MGAKVDGNTVRTQRTRARVLAESLRLFNERGEANVATGTIAEALDISPGNLYYHFRSKEQIVEELFARFEERIDVDPGPASSGPAPRYARWGPESIEDLWLYLHLMLEGIWDYRFLYRNIDDLVARNRRLRQRFNRIADRKLAAVVSLCESLVRAKLMHARDDEIRALAANVLVVSTYWLSFRALRGGRASEAADIGQAAFQVMALVAPYLAEEARAHLDRLGRHYID
jgi:AcrR family transcriptional regulator